MEPQNRGLLLDVVVFFFNLLSMTILARLLGSLIHQANVYRREQIGITIFFLALIFLQPVGGILKRRSAHQRNPDLRLGAGCLLVGVFLAQLLFLIAAISSIVELIYGRGGGGKSPDYFGLAPGLFTALFIGVPLLALANTAIINFYFHKPKHEPFIGFLKSPRAEHLGDSLLFFNMICFQMLWGYLMTELPKDYSGIGMRFFTFAFTALLIYIPPRLFYLAEDYEQPLTWMTMLLANSPIILRLLFASSPVPPNQF